MEQILWYIVFSLVGLLAFIILLIGRSVLLRKSNNRRKYKLKRLIFSEMAQLLTKESYDPSPDSVRTINKAARSSRGLWFVAKQFAKVQEIIEIEQTQMPHPFLSAFGIENRIARKLKSKQWSEKAYAIQYSYELGFRSHLKEIKELVDHKNKIVRREAQIGIVVFLGWKSLPLLAKISHPISLWQQIRIIDNLKYYHPNPSTANFSKVLSTESRDNRELIMRLIHAFSITEHYSFIEEHVSDEDDFLSSLAQELSDSISEESEIKNQIQLRPQKSMPHE